MDQKRESLRYLERNVTNLAPDIEERLKILTQVAVVLGIDDLSFLSCSSALSRLSSDEIFTKRSQNCLETAEQDICSHLEASKYEEQLISKWIGALNLQQETNEDVASIDGKREALLKKAREYQKQLEVLSAKLPGDTSVTVTELVEQQERIKKKEHDLKLKRGKIKAFQGLPPNLNLARLELRNAQNEQIKLIQIREKILGKMADGVA